jgi:clan AA aspartic protease
MMLGHVRDRFPRITLSLPGRGGPLLIEFIVDTGFDGDLALPQSMISRLEATISDAHDVRLADGSQQERAYYEVSLEWQQESRLAEVLVLEYQPLLGVGLMEGSLLQAEMQTGGEVSLEPL